MLGVGVAGLGRAATFSLPALARHPHVRIVAGADTSPQVLENFTREYPSSGYTSVEALCDDANVDAVYIATPTHLHTEHVLAAVSRGKHVIVEKPLAITLEDADRMIEAVEQAGVRMIVGHSQSYEPAVRAMREMVRSGELGRFGMINGWYFNDWLYRPRLPSELDTRLGGGVVFRQGAHHFDIARLIGGGMLRSVRASVTAWDRQRPTEGSYSVYLEFDDGAAATLVYSGYDHFFTTELTGQTESGTRVVPGARPQAEARRALRTAAAASENGEIAMKGQAGFGGTGRSQQQPSYAAYFGLTLVSCEHGDMRQTPNGVMVYGSERGWEIPLPAGITGRDLMIAELYDAVVHNVPTLHSPRWAKATLEVSLAVLESATTRREVQLAHQVPTNDGGTSDP